MSTRWRFPTTIGPVRRNMSEKTSSTAQNLNKTETNKAGRLKKVNYNYYCNIIIIKLNNCLN